MAMWIAFVVAFWVGVNIGEGNSDVGEWFAMLMFVLTAFTALLSLAFGVLWMIL